MMNPSRIPSYDLNVVFIQQSGTLACFVADHPVQLCPPVFETAIGWQTTFSLISEKLDLLMPQNDCGQ